MKSRVNKISNIILFVHAIFFVCIIMPVDGFFRISNIIIKILGVPMYLYKSESFFDIFALLLEVVFIITLIAVHVIYQFWKKNFKKLIISTILQLIILGYLLMHYVVISITEEYFGGCSPLFLLLGLDLSIHMVFLPPLLFMILVLICILVIQIKTSRQIANEIDS